MKYLSIIVLLFIYTHVDAKNYYFSTSGSDANTTTQAQSTATPWKTLAKLNSIFGTLNPGDSVLFKRGDTFYGTIAVAGSGTSGHAIILGAYGTGARPVITGFTAITSWASLGSNLWESSSAVSTLSTCNMVVFGNQNVRMGRYPNTGYVTYQGQTGTTLTASGLPASTTNWAGAEVVVRMNRYVIDRNIITGHSGNVMTYTTTDGNYNPAAGFGCFIQNDPRTLDLQNEWYYNPSTKKLLIYSTTSPTNVQLATIANLVTIGTNSYIVFDNINFIGANNDCFNLIDVSQNAGHITIQNCNANFAGFDGIEAYPNVPYLIVTADSVKSCNNAGVFLNSSDNVMIINNVVDSNGVYAGMGAAAVGSYSGVMSYGNTGIINYNKVTNSGYDGIMFDGDATIVKDNYVNTFGFVTDDGGGIYTFPSQGPRVYTTKTVQGNIVLNGIGAGTGTTSPSTSEADGIYNDGSNSNTNYLNNYVANCNLGIFLNNAHETTVRGNTTFNCNRGFYLIRYSPTQTITNVSVYKNIFVAKTSSQYAEYLEPMGTIMPSTFRSDSNVYARPINETTTIWADSLVGSSNFNKYYTLANWKTAPFSEGQDTHSTISPVTVTDTNNLRFEYNETGSAKTVSLGVNYIDFYDSTYGTSTIIPPYSSVVLIKNSISNVLPVAHAGSDISITSPTSTVTLTGTGTDVDGTITAYLWTKIAGPSGGTVTSSSSATTPVTGLSVGTYLFALQVTDNASGTASDTVTVLVNAAENVPPTANAGVDKSIQLPTSSVSMTGTGTDTDGSIASYSWTKISGPSTFTLSGAGTSVLTASNLVAGTYVFQLQVTDNQGATGIDQATVIVSLATNIPPIANAGTDQSITLPTSSVNLTGTGTDADGMIASYLWTKLSGGSATIVSSATSSTVVNNLVSGTYSFKLQVIDDRGAVATDTVSIVVHPATNIPPVANAGPDLFLARTATNVIINGSGTDADGTIVSYSWIKISGPARGVIRTPTNLTASPVLISLANGIYVYQLTVTDNNGATGVDRVTINVTGKKVVINTGSKFYNQYTIPAP